MIKLSAIDKIVLNPISATLKLSQEGRITLLFHLSLAGCSLMSFTYNVCLVFLKRLLPAYLLRTTSQTKLPTQIRGPLSQDDESCSWTHLCAVETLLSLPGSLSVLPSSTCCRGDPVWSTTSLLLTSTPRMRTPPPPSPAPTQPGRAVAMPVVMTGSASARLPSQDIGELRFPATTTGGSAGFGEPLRGASRA